MGFIDKVKGLLGGKGQQAQGEVDKAGGVVDGTTGGSHSDQISSATEQAKDTIEKPGDGA